jgi:hypothetical protein
MTLTTILSYKIFIFWSNAQHWSGRTIVTQHAYSLFIVPMITKASNNASDSNKYLLHWFNKH